MAVTPHQPQAFGLPADAVERTDLRARDRVVFQRPTGERVVVAMTGLHYQDDAGDWQPMDLTVEPSDDPDFTDEVNRARYRLRQARDGRRRIYPRRDRLDEYVEFGALQARAGQSWQTIPWPTHVRGGNVITLERPNAALTLSLDAGRVKLDLTLTDASAAAPLRWPVSLHGLSRSGWSLVADSDGATVAIIDPLTLTDATGEERTVNASIVGGAVQFTADVSGLTYPVVVDPTVTLDIGSSADDGYVTRSGSTYPPSGSPIVFGSSTVISASRTFAATGGGHVINSGVMWFETALEPNVAITSATLRVWVTAKNDADGRNLVAGWYPEASRPLDASDWTSAVETSALAGVDITAITVGALNDFALQNLDQINTSGFTGLRFGIDGGQPSGINQVVWSSFDQTVNPKPQLIITYDVTSQTISGQVSPPISAISGLTASGSASTRTSVTLDTNAALASEALGQTSGTATLASMSDLTGDYRIFVDGSGTFAATAALTGHAETATAAAAALEGASDLTLAPTVSTTAAGIVSGASLITPLPFSLLSGAVALAASGDLMANGAAVNTGASLVGPLHLAGGTGELEASGGDGRLALSGASGRLGSED